nr:hypothetical protein Iba_chr05aCG14240 [Ipomoea batatas]
MCRPQWYNDITVMVEMEEWGVTFKSSITMTKTFRTFGDVSLSVSISVTDRTNVCVANVLNAAVEISEGADHVVLVHEFDNCPHRQRHEVEQEIHEGLVGFCGNDFSCLLVNEELQTHG